MLSHAAIVAIASTLCTSSGAIICVLLLTAGLMYMKLKSSNGSLRAMADTVYNFEMGGPSPVHVYETIVPKTAMSTTSQEEKSMNKNIAYGPIYAVCKY